MSMNDFYRSLQRNDPHTQPYQGLGQLTMAQLEAADPPKPDWENWTFAARPDAPARS